MAAREQRDMELREDVKEADEILVNRLNRANGDYQVRKRAINKYKPAQDQAAVSVKGREALGAANSNGGAASAEVAKSLPRIVNDLIMGGSNAATRLQILGPTLQNETKKQTSILEKIAQNTEKTADNTEEKPTDMKLEKIDA